MTVHEHPLRTVERAMDADAGDYECLEIETQQALLALDCAAGEELFEDAALDLLALNRKLVGRRAMFAINPFLTKKLALPALLELTHYWQCHSSFSLGVCIELASTMLWGIDLGGLCELNTGFERIPPHVLENGRLVRGDVADAWRVEEIDAADAQKLLDRLDRLAMTVCDAMLPHQLIADMIRLNPDSIVVATRADLTLYMQSIDRDDLRRAALNLFPRGKLLA